MINTTVPELIGKIISNCGVLEHFVNILIMRLATDVLLASSITKYNIRRKLDMLVFLIQERTDCSKIEIDKLKKKLIEVIQNRNDVAHCMAVQGEQDKHITVLKWKNGECDLRKLEKDDLIQICQESEEAISDMSIFSEKLLNQQAN